MKRRDPDRHEPAETSAQPPRRRREGAAAPRGEEASAGPGPRRDEEVETPREAPHVTRNDRDAPVQRSTSGTDDVPVLPANAHGRDRLPAHREVSEVDPESMYDNRPGEDKDRRQTEMP